MESSLKPKKKFKFSGKSREKKVEEREKGG